MSFFVSESIKDRLDEETFLEKESQEEFFILTVDNLKKIKYLSNQKIMLSFFCKESLIDNFFQENIKTIKFRNVCFKKIKLKQIVINQKQCILKILCEEKKIENN